MKIAEWTFSSNTERDEFLSRTWPRRRSSIQVLGRIIPGLYIVPGRQKVIVSHHRITLIGRTGTNLDK